MKILTPGHKYELANFDNPQREGQVIQFIEKEGGPATQLTLINDGTTNEEVLSMLLDRLIFLNGKLPSWQTGIAIAKIEEALEYLNKRTEDRRSRGVEGTHAA